MKTIAAVLYKIGEPLKIEELVIPELKPGQVLVNISYSGVCHTQLNELRGLKGEDKFLPHTLGHEGSGVVEEIGPGVDKVKPGDKVVLTWIRGSGADVPSASYRRKDGSTVNSGAISTFMIKSVISENRLVRIPDEMPMREAALLGCAIPTGAGIVINTARLSKGATIAIFGMGGVGLSALLAAKISQSSVIIAIDILDHKLDNVLKFGATHVINARNQPVLSEILSITNGRGVDLAIECAGKKESMEIAFQSVRDNGGLCVLAGNLPHGERISINPFDLIRGKRITGSWGGDTQPDRDIPKYIEYYLSRDLPLDRLITYSYGLADVNQALYDLESGIIGRALIDMSLDRKG